MDSSTKKLENIHVYFFLRISALVLRLLNQKLIIFAPHPTESSESENYYVR